MIRTKSAAYDTGRIEMENNYKKAIEGAKELLAIAKVSEVDEDDQNSFFISLQEEGIFDYEAEPHQEYILGATITEIFEYVIEVLCTDIAKLFSDYIHQSVGDENMAKIVRLTKEEPSESICHSHDFCDANVDMMEAMEVFGFPYEIHDEKEDNSVIDTDKMEDYYFVSQKSWGIAKKNLFFVGLDAKGNHDVWRDYAKEYSTLLLEKFGEEKLRKVTTYIESALLNSYSWGSKYLYESSQLIDDVLELHGVDINPASQDDRERIGRMVEGINNIAEKNKFFLKKA